MKEATVCNLCGAKLDFWDRQGDYSLDKNVGYGSTHDGEHIHLHLCCKCFDYIVDSCKVSPKTGGGDL